MVSQNFIVLKAVLKGLVKFFILNEINQNSYSLLEETNNIRKKLKVLVNKTDPLIYSIYFNLKIQLKE